MRAAVWAAVLSIVGCNQQQSYDPDGFRGIAWGTQFEQVKDQMETGAVPWGPVPSDQYERKGDKLSFGNVPVNRILYQFDKGQFERVTIYTMTSLLDVLKAQFGEPRERPNGFLWTGSKTDVFYSCDLSIKRCTAAISSHVFNQLQDQERERVRRENLESARKDF